MLAEMPSPVMGSFITFFFFFCFLLVSQAGGKGDKQQEYLIRLTDFNNKPHMHISGNVQVAHFQMLRQLPVIYSY